MKELLGAGNGHFSRKRSAGTNPNRAQTIDQPRLRFAPKRSQQKCVNRFEIRGLFRPDQGHGN